MLIILSLKHSLNLFFDTARLVDRSFRRRPFTFKKQDIRFNKPPATSVQEVQRCENWKPKNRLGQKKGCQLLSAT